MSLQEMISRHPQVTDATLNEALVEASRHANLCAQFCTSCAEACVVDDGAGDDPELCSALLDAGPRVVRDHEAGADRTGGDDPGAAKEASAAGVGAGNGRRAAAEQVAACGVEETGKRVVRHVLREGGARGGQRVPRDPRPAR